MAKYVTLKGFDEFIEAFETLGNKAPNMCKRMVYAGANVCKDAVAANLRAALSKDERNVKRRTGDLEAALGIAKIEVNGAGANTSVGFDGYGGKHKTALPLQANVLESGRSDRAGTGFFSKAIRASRKGAQAAMKERFESYINTVMEDLE